MEQLYPNFSRLDRVPELFSAYSRLPGTYLNLSLDGEDIICTEKNGSRNEDHGNVITQLWGEQFSFLLKKFPLVLCAFLHGENAEDWTPWINRFDTIDGPIGICLVGIYSKDSFHFSQKGFAGICSIPFVGLFHKKDIAVVCEQNPYFSPGLFIHDMTDNRLYIHDQDIIEIPQHVKASIRKISDMEEARAILVQAGFSAAGADRVIATEIIRERTASRNM